MTTQYHKKTIGILGGMGPSASADFYKKIIYWAQKKYGARQDADFPPMFIYNLPLFGFNETGVADEKLVKKQLIKGVKKLEDAGSDFIVIPCNSVHYFYRELQQAVKIPIVNIIAETLKVVKRRRQKSVGVLSSQSTNKLKLYEKELQKNNIKPLSPDADDQKKINQIILKIMSGKQGAREKQTLKKITNRLFKRGATAIILGCTELPLLLKQSDFNKPLFDAGDILAQSALQYYKKNQKNRQ